MAKTVYVVCYVYTLGVGCDQHTKYEYDNVDDAVAKMNELAALTGDQLREQEGIDPPPYMFRILSITSP